MKRSILVAMTALAVTVAFAHDGMHGPGAQFDTDVDGSISLAEYTVYLKVTQQDDSAAQAMFAKADTDKSGNLSAAEFILSMPKGTAK